MVFIVASYVIAFRSVCILCSVLAPLIASVLSLLIGVISIVCIVCCMTGVLCVVVIAGIVHVCTGRAAAMLCYKEAVFQYYYIGCTLCLTICELV